MTQELFVRDPNNAKTILGPYFTQRASAARQRRNRPALPSTTTFCSFLREFSPPQTSSDDVSLVYWQRRVCVATQTRVFL